MKHEPGLALAERGTWISIAGEMTVDIGAGIPRRYRLELVFRDRDPYRPPEVWDRGRSFPPLADRHIENLDPKSRSARVHSPAAPRL